MYIFSVSNVYFMLVRFMICISWLWCKTYYYMIISICLQKQVLILTSAFFCYILTDVKAKSMMMIYCTLQFDQDSIGVYQDKITNRITWENQTYDLCNVWDILVLTDRSTVFKYKFSVVQEAQEYIPVIVMLYLTVFNKHENISKVFSLSRKCLYSLKSNRHFFFY